VDVLNLRPDNAPTEGHANYRAIPKTLARLGFFAVSSGMRNENDGLGFGSANPKGD
jgi:hypothetical protein